MRCPDIWYQPDHQHRDVTFTQINDQTFPQSSYQLYTRSQIMKKLNPTFVCLNVLRPHNAVEDEIIHVKDLLLAHYGKEMKTNYIYDEAAWTSSRTHSENTYLFQMSQFLSKFIFHKVALFIINSLSLENLRVVCSPIIWTPHRITLTLPVLVRQTTCP